MEIASSNEVVCSTMPMSVLLLFWYLYRSRMAAEARWRCSGSRASSSAMEAVFSSIFCWSAARLPWASSYASVAFSTSCCVSDSSYSVLLERAWA